jgi:hypothetical protein
MFRPPRLVAAARLAPLADAGPAKFGLDIRVRQY